MAKGKGKSAKLLDHTRGDEAAKRRADKEQTLLRNTARENKSVAVISKDMLHKPKYMGRSGTDSSSSSGGTSQSFQEVSEIKAEMEEISNLLCHLQMESYMLAMLPKARRVKARLEELDLSNLICRNISDSYKEGSTVDRTGMSVTCGLRGKLREIMNNVQSLREKVVADHKEDSTAEVPSDEMVDKMVFGSLKVELFEGKTELDMGNKVRHEAVTDILTELHQVFLDMAVLVEAPGEDNDNIEENVANAGYFVSGGTNSPTMPAR